MSQDLDVVAGWFDRMVSEQHLIQPFAPSHAAMEAGA